MNPNWTGLHFQRWSFGPFADLLWDTVPELQLAIRDLLGDRLQEAIDRDAVPEVIDDRDYVDHVIDGAREAVEQDRAEPDLLEHLVDFLWAVVRYSGPDSDRLHDRSMPHLSENLNTEPMLGKLREADPQIVAEVRTRWGRWG